MKSKKFSGEGALLSSPGPPRLQILDPPLHVLLCMTVSKLGKLGKLCALALQQQNTKTMSYCFGSLIDYEFIFLATYVLAELTMELIFNKPQHC